MHKITKVSYSQLANLGNYENEKVELEATLEEGDNWQDVLEDLRQKVLEVTKGINDYMKTKNEIYDRERELRDLLVKVDKAKATWETVSTFLKAQGLNNDPAKFPELPQLEQAEIVDEDDRDDEFPV